MPPFSACGGFHLSLLSSPTSQIPPRCGLRPRGSEHLPWPGFQCDFRSAEGLEGSLEKARCSCSLSTDPLDKPLVGQDEFFLEQTKKKGVRVSLHR